jgi:hypothetical protein
MKNNVVKNIGNIGLLVFSAGMWFDVIFGGRRDGRVFSAPAIALSVIGLVMVGAHIVIRQRAKKAGNKNDKEP